MTDNTLSKINPSTELGEAVSSQPLHPYFDLEMPERSAFSKGYQKSNLLQMVFFSFVNKTMDVIYKRDIEIANSQKADEGETTTRGVTTQAAIQNEDLIDMNLWGGHAGKGAPRKVVREHGQELFNETEEISKRFEKLVRQREEKARKKGEKPNYYNILKMSVLDLTLKDLLVCIVLATISEGMSCYYAYQLKDLVKFIKYAPNDDKTEGYLLAAWFVGSMVIAQVFRNFYLFYGMTFSLNIRKALVTGLFNKVTKLSMKSIAITNSGKLISLISADLFLLEKGLSFTSLLFASPFVTLFAGYLLWDLVGWEKTLISFSFWILNLLAQSYATKVGKVSKPKESAINDNRLKYINDMVVGCRTIKCYGWENHYIQNIKHLRQLQDRELIKNNFIQNLGTCFFSNTGLITVLVLFIIDWKRGIKLENENVMASLAMLHLIFYALNLLIYFSLSNF